MANRKKSTILFSLLALTAILISACERSFSSVPLETPEAEVTSLFVSPFPTSDNPMAMVEELSTGTALAETAAALTAGTPLATTVAGTEITPDINATATQTPILSVVCTAPACAADQTLICPSGSTCSGGCGMVCAANTPTSTGIVSQPSSGGAGESCTSPYTLQKGEFPYCIARRCNVDPAALLSANGLSSGNLYMPGLRITIPSGSSFPDGRALAAHPATYTVLSSDETFYSIACKYGDVDPVALARANSVSVGSALTAGQSLTIP